MSDTVVAIVSAFFVMGIIVGLITVVAISILRVGRRNDPGDSLDYRSHGPEGQPPHLLRDDAGPDDHPRWPGDADNDFSGR